MNRADPFLNDADRRELWDIIVRRDIEAFLSKDWEALKDTFIEKGFFGIDGRLRANIDSWRLTFPTLEAYRREWLKQAAYYTRHFKRGLRETLYKATRLHSIEIKDGIALVHMKFEGWLAKTGGQRLNLPFQTLWICRKSGGTWKAAGFVGYLPTVFQGKAWKAEDFEERPRIGIWQHVNTLSDVSALRSLLAELEQTPESSMATAESLWLERACALLNRDLSSHVSYCALAAEMDVSYEGFRHRFRRLTGMSPNRYRQSRIVDQACQLLATSHWTVAEVATELGFCDAFHFSRTFKKFTGESPTMFRRSVLAQR